ncbi:non-specific lipid-transfer-like protein [Corchorus olitorius]|uniref:Non-specific lipid-transfer-like protein n=1 Tax=Corchorus olitorius TaxID=93759 RepID=A0A1R3HER8_9ROSI|nr:non-specific lipid-transfer-like protein [Corchorus olitorius]
MEQIPQVVEEPDTVQETQPLRRSPRLKLVAPVRYLLGHNAFARRSMAVAHLLTLPSTNQTQALSLLGACNVQTPPVRHPFHRQPRVTEKPNTNCLKFH